VTPPVNLYQQISHAVNFMGELCGNLPYFSNLYSSAVAYRARKLPVDETKFTCVDMCHSGKTRHINSSFRIIGNDDLDTWWKEVIGLDIIEQPLVTCCALDLSAGLDSAHVPSSAMLPDVVLAGTCWVLVRVVWYCSTPGERGKVEEWPCK
jgi:hypothetical protein